MITRVILSLVSVLIGFVVYFIIIGSFKRKITKLENLHLDLVKKFSKFLLIITVLISFGFIWGLDFENVWASLIGIIALVGIGFVAVWSLLSNIIAGIIILFTKPFRLNDEIIILGDNIKGKVHEITLTFTTLSDGEGMIKIPNNMIFQKIIKNLNKK